MEKVIERRRNIYIYILATILFCLLGIARIDAYAAYQSMNVNGNGGYWASSGSSTYTLNCVKYKSFNAYESCHVYQLPTEKPVRSDGAVFYGYCAHYYTSNGYWVGQNAAKNTYEHIFSEYDITKKKFEDLIYSDINKLDKNYTFTWGNLTFTYNTQTGTENWKDKNGNVVTGRYGDDGVFREYRSYIMDLLHPQYTVKSLIRQPGELFEGFTAIAIWGKPEGFNITFNVNGGSTSISSQTVSTISLPSPGSKTGYTFDGWYNGNTRIGGAGTSWTPTADATITAKWTPRTDTKYVVKHQLMNVNGSGYTLKDTETLKGTTDTSVTPATKTYTGFTAPAKQTVNINADGSRVVTYSYSRNKYTFTLGSNASVYSHGINTSGSSSSGSYYYGATITLKASPKAGYTWSKWSDENTSTSRTLTMPADNLTITPQANLITYNIRYNLFKGSVSGNPATYTVETPTFTLKNPTLAGFTFLGWTSPANREAKTAYQIPKGSVGDITVSANWVSGKLSDDSLNTQGGNGSSDSGNSDNTDPDNARSKNTKTQHNNFKIG